MRHADMPMLQETTGLLADLDFLPGDCVPHPSLLGGARGVHPGRGGVIIALRRSLHA